MIWLIMAGTWITRILSTCTALLSTPRSANSFYHSDDYDAAYAKAVSADTEKGQWEAYKECDAILAKDLPVSVILHSMNTYLFDDTNYEGLVYSCGNYVFTYLKAL